MQSKDFHRSNLISSTIVGRSLRRIWKAYNHLHTIMKSGFEDAIRTAFGDFGEDSDIIYRMVDRLGNDLAEFMDIELASSFGQAQGFVIPVIAIVSV